MFAVRVFAGLERSGFHFSSAYPPQEARIEVLFQTLRQMSPSEQVFHEILTVAASFTRWMDATDDIIAGGRSVSKRDRRFALATMIAQLEEFASGQLPEDQFLTDFAEEAESLPMPV